MPSKKSDQQIMDIHEAARYLHISADTLYKYASKGMLPAFKLGNRWRFDRRLLDEKVRELSNVVRALPTP